MRIVPLLIILGVTSVTGPLVFAAEPAPGDAQTDKQSTDKAAAAAGDAADKKADKKVADDAEARPGEKPAEKSEPAKSAADKGPSPQRFIPSEQVRADFDVSFPIDI